MKHGKFTADFGKTLGQKLDGNGLVVWYDHGDPAKDPHVLKTSGYYGKELSNLSKLAEIDIMVTEGNKIKCLIELEETSVSPKKLLGDALAVCLCNGFAINRERKHEHYLFDDETKLFIASWFNPKGKGAAKVEELEKRFKQFKGWGDGLMTANVIFVHSDSLTNLMVELDNQVSAILCLDG